MVGNKDTQQRKSCKARTSQDMGILRHVKNFVLCLLQPPPAAAAGSEWATIAWRLTSWPHYNEFKQ